MTNPLDIFSKKSEKQTLDTFSFIKEIEKFDIFKGIEKNKEHIKTNLFSNFLTKNIDIFREEPETNYDIFKQHESNSVHIFSSTNINENVYSFQEIIDNSIEKNIEPIKEFVQVLVNEKDVYLDLFYYPVSQTQSVLVLNKEVDNNILQELCNFCDYYKIMLSVDYDVSGELLKQLDFIINDDLNIDEYIIRHPKQNISESVTMFSNLGKTSRPIDIIGTNIQSYIYRVDWYNEYLEIINSKDYKKRRHMETHGVLLNRNAKKNRGCNPRVGFAIVGKCKVQ